MSQPPQPPDQPYGYPQQPYGYPPQPPAAPEPNPYAQQPQAAPEQNPYGQQQPADPYGYPQQQPGWGEPSPYDQPYGGPQPGYPGYEDPQQPYGGQPGYADPQQGYYQQPSYDPQAYPGQQPYQQPYDPQMPAYQQPVYEQPAYQPPPPPAGPPEQPPTAPAPQPGYPAQAHYPDPGGQSGADKPSGKLYGMIAGILALVLVIGGGIWLLTSGGSGGGTQAAGGGGAHDTTGQLRWTVGAPKVAKAQIVSPTPGMWFAGKDVVKESTTVVTGYNLASGHADWQVPVPAGHTCDATSTAAGGKVAVQYGVHCENVMGINLTTGKLLWHKPLASGSSDDSFVFSNADMAVSGDTVAVAWDDNAAAFDLTTGKPQWHAASGGSCQDQGFAGGSKMVEVYKCGEAENAPYHVRLINPATGKAQWTWDAPADTSVTNVLSVDPVVVGIGAGDDLITDIWDIDGGRLQGKIALGKNSQGLGKYAINCPATQMTPCHDVAVAGGTLYLATRAHAGGKQDGSLTNEIAAFNLSTGNPKWLSKDGSQPMDVVTTQGDSVIAYQESGYDTPGAIIAANTANGALSTYTTFSADTQSREHDAYGPGVSGLVEQWQSGTLAMSLTEVDSSGEYPTLMAVLR